MKFTVSSTALNSRLQMLARVINSKNSMPILGSFLFEVHNNTLAITASDSENVVRTEMPLDETEGEGNFAVPSATILAGMKELPEQPLNIEVTPDTFEISVKYQNGHFDWPAQDAADYPQTAAVAEGSNVITIDAGLLLGCISRSLFATAQDEIRPVMNGIYFDLQTDALAIVASDGHKLVRNRCLAIKSETPASFILPKKPAQLLKGMLTKDSGDVVIRFDARNAEIKTADARLNCRLIEGRYPNYNAVVPADNPNVVTINRLGLLGALRRVLPFASESSQLVRFRLDIGQLKLTSEDIDYRTKADESIVCDYSGQPMSIGFKGSSLVEILNNLDCEEVNILLGDPSRAGVIVPADQAEDVDILMLIMPMLLSD